MIYLLLGSSKEKKKHLILHFFCFTLIQNTEVCDRLLVVFNGNDEDGNSAVETFRKKLHYVETANSLTQWK